MYRKQRSNHNIPWRSWSYLVWLGLWTLSFCPNLLYCSLDFCAVSFINTIVLSHQSKKISSGQCQKWESQQVWTPIVVLSWTTCFDGYITLVLFYFSLEKKNNKWFQMLLKSEYQKAKFSALGIREACWHLFQIIPLLFSPNTWLS